MEELLRYFPGHRGLYECLSWSLYHCQEYDLAEQKIIELLNRDTFIDPNHYLIMSLIHIKKLDTLHLNQTVDTV